MGNFRKQRVSELLLGFLGGELRRLSDPRLSFVTLTGVDISPDLKSARVYWSLLGISCSERAASGELASQFPEDKTIAETGDALKKAKLVLKKRVASELKLRFTPELNFIYDKSIESGARIDMLLSKD